MCPERNVTHVSGQAGTEQAGLRRRLEIAERFVFRSFPATASGDFCGSEGGCASALPLAVTERVQSSQGRRSPPRSDGGQRLGRGNCMGRAGERHRSHHRQRKQEARRTRSRADQSKKRLGNARRELQILGSGSAGGGLRRHAETDGGDGRATTGFPGIGRFTQEDYGLSAGRDAFPSPVARSVATQIRLALDAARARVGPRKAGIRNPASSVVIPPFDPRPATFASRPWVGFPIGADRDVTLNSIEQGGYAAYLS